MDSCIDLFLWRATENCGDWSEIELQGEGKATPQKDYDNILVASFQFRNFFKTWNRFCYISNNWYSCCISENFDFVKEKVKGAVSINTCWIIWFENKYFETLTPIAKVIHFNSALGKFRLSIKNWKLLLLHTVHTKLYFSNYYLRRPQPVRLYLVLVYLKTLSLNKILVSEVPNT